MNPKKKKVVVTGLGAVTPVGNTVAAFMKALFEGQSGAGPVTRFDTTNLPTRVAAEVKDFDSAFRDVKISFALQAAREAMDQSFGQGARLESCRSGLSIGLGLELFSMDHLVEFQRQGFTPTGDRLRDLTFMNTPSDLCVQSIGHAYGLTRAPRVHISACAAGTDAIGDAYRAIADGELDVAIAGGTDSMINPMGLGGFCRIGAMTQRNDSPTDASRPFDQTRDGFVLGEGAGFLVLEEESRARGRGAEILARISGYGGSLDAYSVSDPHPEGQGAQLAMRRALADAGLGAEQIDAVSAHGTSTPKNDPAESAAIAALLGERASAVPVISTKSMIGHLISAAGAVETVAVVEMLRAQRLHATRNLKQVDPACARLRHVTEGPLALELRHVMKNSFGFGGQNACIIVSGAENGVVSAHA